MIQGWQDSMYRLRFNRNEWAGAFGDIGTDVPLMIGMIAACGLDPASTMIVFGAMQILTACLYGIPMPVQPLKVVAALAIAGQVEPGLIHGAGLAVGLILLLLTLTGLLDRLHRLIPRAVVRGLQAGLGVKLAVLAFTAYIPADGTRGLVLAGLGFGMATVLGFQRRYPPALLLVFMGAVYAWLFHFEPGVWARSWGIALPRLQVPSVEDVAAGFLLLALPQIPLSLGNSILATHQVARDLFPDRPVTLRKIGLTYALMNLVCPFLGGIPVCHGAGGMAGHYAFGGRTGGSVAIYGALILALGLCFSQGLAEVIQIFPLPILGVILFFEGVTLIRFMRDLVASVPDFALAAGVAVSAAFLPHGFLVAIVIGTVLHRARERWMPAGGAFRERPAGATEGGGG